MELRFEDTEFGLRQLKKLLYFLLENNENNKFKFDVDDTFLTKAKNWGTEGEMENEPVF